MPLERLPASLLRFTLPSRYAETDKLLGFAWNHFAQVPAGWQRARAICEWVHRNIAVQARHAASRTGRPPTRSRGAKGCAATARTSWSRCAARSTCRRATRSPTCPTSTCPTTASPWTFTPTPRSGSTAAGRSSIRTTWRRARGRVFIASGLDAADAAFATLYGGARLTRFEVWADRAGRRRPVASDALRILRAMLPAVAPPPPPVGATHVGRACRRRVSTLTMSATMAP